MDDNSFSITHFKTDPQTEKTLVIFPLECCHISLLGLALCSYMTRAKFILRGLVPLTKLCARTPKSLQCMMHDFTRPDSSWVSVVELIILSVFGAQIHICCTVVSYRGSPAPGGQCLHLHPPITEWGEGESPPVSNRQLVPTTALHPGAMATYCTPLSVHHCSTTLVPCT